MLDIKGIYLGVATASSQIEGGEVGSNWNAYSDAGKITDGSNVKRAADHWNRYEEDIALMKELGVKHCRMSLEWSRLEPVQGQFDDAAFEHYRKEIQLMKDLGIHVLLTFYHFSHPIWFEDLKSFEKEDNIPIFLAYVQEVVKRLGDLVDDYCTINEPNVYAVNSYFLAEWLHEEKDFFKTTKVLSVFATSHILIYKWIHDYYRKQDLGPVTVTFAIHMRYFQPATHSPLDRFGTKALDFLFHTGVFKAFALGKFSYPFKNMAKVEQGQYIDYIGVNYYSRGLIKGFEDTVKQDAIKNDLGWEIYPEGIGKVCQALHDILPLTIRITENGTCDNTDSFRCRFIYDHLKALVDSGLPVTHYYHWCFTDNFEWKEGELPRFGLIHLNYDNQKRTPKFSFYFYKKLIEKGEVDQECYEEFVEPSLYHHGEKNILTGLLPDEELRNKR